MKNHGHNDTVSRRRVKHANDPMAGEPSMSAPSPMPGKTAASPVKQQSADRASQMDWQSAQNQQVQASGMGWNTRAYDPNDQGYAGYPAQQGYPHPTQGGQPHLQYGWQQGYPPAQQSQGWSQPYQQPAGQGWTQQPKGQNSWQGGYNVNPWNGNGYTPAPADMGAAQNGQGNGGSGGKPPVDKNVVKLVAAVAVIVIALVIVVNLISQQSQNQAVYNAVKAYDDLYCQGVYVDGIHLGGMTREEAKQVVQKSAQLKCDEWHVRLETPAKEYVGEINSYHLGMTVHVDDALDEAWEQGHASSDVNERYETMESLAKAPYHISTALPSGDTSAIDRILNDIAANIYVEPTNAYIANFITYATNPFEIVEGTPGRMLDVESIKAQVYDMVSRMESGVIYIEPTVVPPAITKADLEKQTTLIGSHYTPISTTSTENRDMNIKRACDLISGTVIYPGEDFSFNDIVGARTQKNGFHLAIEYAYGEQREGYGGGVCQVSSTIYVAAVRANMQILKRTQHALEVNYTTFGLDATVNYDGKKIDFVFRNNTQSPIYIVTKVMRKPMIDKSHDLVICEIYGPALEEGVTYDLVAETIEVPIPEPTLVPDRKSEYVVYTDETYVAEQGAIGYEVYSYRVKYVNGEEVERTDMYRDTYAPVQPITYVGVNERPLEEW